MKGQKIAPDMYASNDGLLMFWSHSPVAPWQTQAWLVPRLFIPIRPLWP